MAWRSSVLPRSLPDALGMAFMALAAPAAFLFELWVVLPARHPQPCLQLTLHRLIATFFLFSVLTNYVLVILVDSAPTGHPNAAASYCRLCRLHLPPRSLNNGDVSDFSFVGNWLRPKDKEFLAAGIKKVVTCWGKSINVDGDYVESNKSYFIQRIVFFSRAWHCKACGRCILRRDHHCLLTGCCVGLHNYRYFFCMVTHVTAATLYGAALNLWYLGHVTPCSLAGLTRLLFPALAYFLFPEPPRLLAERMLCVASAGMAAACSVLFVLYLRNLLAGLTMAERRKQMNPHPGRSVAENLRQALGLRWPLVFLCPFIPSPLPPQDSLSSHKPTD